MTAKLRVFISSPGDVSEERALAERVFRRLEAEFADHVTLEILLWEHEPLFGHAGFQDQIERPSRCDLVVSILWSRLGTRLPSDFAPSPGEPSPTGTEFEIRDALEAFRRLGKPNLLIYRKSAAPNVNLASAQAEERLRQFRLLEDFCRHAFYDEQGAVLVAHHKFAEPVDFERKLTLHVRKWLERTVGESSGRPRWTGGSPYRGLEVFEAQHREVYFGRGEAVSELLKRMRGTESRASDGAAVTRFLLVSGMSGNGKSSLIRAGLVPLLEGRALEGIGLWRHSVVKPSDRSPRRPEAGATGALAEALVAALPPLGDTYPELQVLADRLGNAPLESAARLDGYLTREASVAGLKPYQVRLVLFVDQLEELFAQPVAAGERAAFLGVLQALSREGRIWVVATLRSDFLPRLEEQPELVTLTREGHTYLLAPPHPDELADMIREPARAAGLEWEDREGVSLDQAILREATANPESLPLLQYALDLLYTRREGRRLSYASYEAFGGLKRGIAGTAERIIVQHGDAATGALPRLFRSLASVGEDGTTTRRYAPLNEFTPGSPERRLLDELLAERLCVTDRRGTEAVVSFAHEALIQSWPRLVEWLQSEAGLLLARDVLISESQRWAKHSEDDDWLVTAPDRLTSLRAVVNAGFTLPDTARRFAERSRQRARRIRRLKQAARTSLVLLSIGIAIFAWIARSQRNAATLASVRAEAEAATSKRTTAFLVDLFRISDPSEARGNAVTAREMLDKGAARIDKELIAQPAIQATLMDTLGSVYTGLGLYDKAEPLLKKAVTTRTRAPGIAPLDLADSLNKQADLFRLQDRLEESEKAYREALRLEQDSGTSPQARAAVATSLHGLGYVLANAGRYAEAEKNLRAALDLQQKLYPSPSAEIARTYKDLGFTAERGGDLNAALSLLTQAVSMQRQLHGSELHPDLDQAIDELAGVNQQRGEYDAAERLFRESLAMKHRLYGSKHPEVALALENLASALQDKGDLAGAEPLYQQALVMSRELLGESHPDVAALLHNLASLQYDRGSVELALANERQALAIRRRALPADHPETAIALNVLGTWLTFAGEYPEAERDLAEALAMRKRMFAADNPAVGSSLAALANLEVAEGRYEQALEAARGAKPIFVAAYSADHWRTAIAEGAEGAALLGLGRAAEAEPLLVHSYAILSKDGGAPAMFKPQVRRYLDRARAAKSHH